MIGMDGNNIYRLLNLHTKTITRTADADDNEYRYPFKELKEKSIPEPPGTERKRKPHSHDKQKATKRRVQLAAQGDVQEDVHTNELEEARIYPSRMLRQRQLQGTGHPAQNVQVPSSSRQRVQVVVEIPRVRPVPTATLVRDALNESCKKRLRKIFSDQVIQHVVALHPTSVHPEDSLISNSESILEETVENARGCPSMDGSNQK